MTAIEFTVLGTPAPQGSKKGFYNKHLRRVQLVDDNKRPLADWRGDVVRAAVEALPGIADASAQPGYRPLFDGAVCVDIEFRFDRPKGHYRTGRNANLLRDTAPTYPTGKPDIDKVLRATLDAITAAKVWRDDAQVVYVEMHKAYADRKRPGATIRIATPGHIHGVDEAQLAQGVL